MNGPKKLPSLFIQKGKTGERIDVSKPRSEKEAPAKKAPPPQVNHQTFSKIADAAIRSVLGTDAVRKDAVDNPVSIFVGSISSGIVKGHYYIAVNQLDSNTAATAAKIFQLLIATMAKAGFEVSPEDCKLTHVSNDQVGAAKLDKGLFYLAFQAGTLEIGCGFVKSEKFAPVLEAGPDGYVAIPIGDLAVGESLPIDAYLFLPMNNKFVKFLRSGMPLDQAALAKLATTKTTKVFVPAEDKARLEAHYSWGAVLSALHS